MDGVGIDLLSIFKWIESRVFNGCCIEVWKKRIYWVGFEVISDVVELIRDVEKDF